MSELFVSVVNMSISASWIIIAVILFRLLLKKVPKWINILLWGIVAVRLVCPFSFESALSLIPSNQTINPETALNQPVIDSGVAVIDSVINPIISETTVVLQPEKEINVFQFIMPYLAGLWCAGIAALLLYTLVSYISLKRKIGTAVLLRDNIYQSEAVVSPFVLGLFRPKIYLPFNINEQNTRHVIAHEQAHILRRDYLWKPLGFLILTLHWFNPMVWLGYILLCRDIELACDEKVIKVLSCEQRADYSEALLTCSVNRRMIAACPLAFGEVGVRDRVRSVMNYKKPAFWVVAVALIASIITAVCFLTDPETGKLSAENQKSGSDVTGVSVEIISTDFTGPDTFIEIKWKNDSDSAIMLGEQFAVYYEEDGNWENCSMIENPVWHLIGYELKAASTTKKIYHLSDQIMTRAGKYRFEAPFSIRGADSTDNKVWVEFELSKGADGMTVYTFDPSELIYTGDSFSFVQTAEGAPLFRIVNGRHLYEKYDIVYSCGIMESIKLDENNFDSRFAYGSFEEGYTLSELKKNNKRAWQVYCERAESTLLYLILEQKDGSFYIGVGYSETGMTEPLNTDSSMIRWLYRVERAEDASFFDMTQTAVDGAVYYYPQSTLQTDIPQYDKYCQLSDDELAALIAQLKDSKWVWDNLVDRTEFYFDGQIYYDGQWIFFGYEQGVFYCGEYFCSVADEAIALIKRSEAGAVKYAPDGNAAEESNTDSGTVIVPIMDAEQLKSKYPMYFELDTSNGLEVYIWQMAENSYSCGLLPARSTVYAGEELWELHKSSATLDEMRSIVAYYMSEKGISRSDVTVKAVSMPHSSYYYSIDEDYRERLNTLFWSELPFFSTQLSPVIDSAVFDIDGDGRDEVCTVSHGPTSGLYTFKLLVQATEEDGSAAEYFNIFNGITGEISFADTDSGMKLRVLTAENKEIFYSFGVRDNNIVLSADGEELSYWGEQGIGSAFAPTQKEDIDEAISRVLEEKYAVASPDGLIHTQVYKVVSHSIISGTPTVGSNIHTQIEKVGIIVYDAEYSVKNGNPEKVQGVFVPTLIVFGVDENGSYVLKEYTTGEGSPLPEGSLLSLFPEDSLNTEEYADELIRESLAKATEIFNND